ncbi:hypothetical protein LAZ67_12000856 [Cordylochernes scorpioides]|uniref:ATP-dependent DNA helicase n=1 Tax=Cordylochernes scorpioides TaxID=51811 RepID=A0ABY6L4U1_9ARAC|nr:hypothetical protein LAZ67_12000856 [Cordylochernes scorpioides]
MEDASMGEQEKLLRLPNYLVRQPLELFRKLRLADRSYFQVRQILLDLYPESSEASFAKYFAMKLTGQANLETYYREKTAMGLQLGLPQEVILETLTEGLPFNDQRLVRVVPPENLGEWFRLVQRIHGPSAPTTRPREDQPPTMSVLRRETLAQRMPTSTSPDDPRKSADGANSPKTTNHDSTTTKSSQGHPSRAALSRLRPDLVARVFNLKLQQLLHEIVSQHVLGVVIARVHVVEFQKRGLPHAHMLFMLREEDKPRDRDAIDRLVCAEIPSPTMQVQLYDMVRKHMIHGPCGNFNLHSPCMSDGKCTKDFPKSFLQLTEANNNGYPRYRRRDDGQTLVVGTHEVDNRWVVPYNPYLLVRFNAHINVEVCASVKSVKYLFKYVYKGHDRAEVEVSVGELDMESRAHDEIKNFLDARAVGKIVIPLASTGIAATLLSGGQTVHSRFKLPIPLLENSVAAISANSSEAELIRRSSLIIWDEAPMAHYRALEIVDRLLKDIMHCDLAFGGKVVVLGGDFRQVLPVVPRASRAEIVAACIKQSKLWPLFVILRLTQNMRAGIDAQSFSQWLLKVGDGDLPTDQQGLISLPESCIFHGVDLVQEIFGSSYGDITALSQSVILTPKNTDSLEINEKVLDRLPNRSQCFLSVDSVECENVEEQNNYPTEFLNSLTPTGMPPHRLNLKIGAIVMLLRNLNPKQGLCNGTRMVIQRMRSHVLEAQILTGTKVGQTVLVPKISLAPSDTNLPFILKRRQFPLRLAFAMTINKAQGQTFARDGEMEVVILLHVNNQHKRKVVRFFWLVGGLGAAVSYSVATPVPPLQQQPPYLPLEMTVEEWTTTKKMKDLDGEETIL